MKPADRTLGRRCSDFPGMWRKTSSRPNVLNSLRVLAEFWPGTRKTSSRPICLILEGNLAEFEGGERKTRPRL